MDISTNWEDTPEHHTSVNNSFAENVNSCDWLKSHRDFVEANAFGFGERSFHWFWKLLVDEMPTDFKFLEIGIFRGQSLSFIKMLASASGRSVQRYGVTPLDSTDGHWESDYRADIERIHEEFFIPKDYELIVGLSTDLPIIQQAFKVSPFDIVYIDGGHTEEVIDSDLKYYAPMVKRGGYLVVDDCCNDLHMKFGYFQGIQPVTDAVNEYMANNNEFEFLFNVVHIKVFKRL